MAFASFIVFFLLSHFASLVIFVGSCPPDFRCGNLPNPISFPFTSTERPGCGLVKLDCTDELPFQKIQLKENGKWYNVIKITPEFTMENTPGGRITIHDEELKKQLDPRNCHTFNNFSLPNSPSISFTFPNLTVFKCTHPQEAYFKNSSHYNQTCPGYSIYYYYNHTNGDLYGDPSMPTGSLSRQCSVIQLPSSGEHEKPDDPFTHLTAHFSLEYGISIDCHKCHIKGGNCSNDSRGNFRCLKKENHKSRRVVILATGNLLRADVSKKPQRLVDAITSLL